MNAERELIGALTDRRVWRAGGGPLRPRLPTGHARLDAALGGGWPAAALSELAGRPAGGELTLLLPVLARASRTGLVLLAGAPHLPYAPALAAAGMDLRRLLVVPAAVPADRFFALEQALRSSACTAAVGWFEALEGPLLRRLQLAAGRGGALGAVSVARPVPAAPVALRLALRPVPEGVEVSVRKGGVRAPASFTLELWDVAGAAPADTRPGCTAAIGC